MKRTVLPLGLAALLASTSAWAMKVPTSSTDFDLNINILLQGRTELTFEQSYNKSLDTDFFLRRARLQASGTAYKMFSFLIQFDNSNLGKRGTATSVTAASNPAFVQDVVIGWTPFPDFTIEGGLILTPTLRTLGLSSSGGQVRIEAPIDLIFQNLDRGFRMNGVELRGFLVGHLIGYRAGVFEGFHSAAPSAGTAAATQPAINAHGRPMVGGHVRVNLIGDETGYAYNQMYMDGKVRASVGGAVQYQPGGACFAGTFPGTTTAGNVCSFNGAGTAASPFVANDYKMFGFDGFLDMPLPGNDVELSVDASAVRWDYGESRNSSTAAAGTNVGFLRTGWGYTAGAALRFGAIAVYGDFWQFAADSGTTIKLADRRKWAGGLAWFLKGHADKITLEFNSIVPGNNPPGGVNPNPNGIAPIASGVGLKAPAQNAIWLQAQAAF